VGALAKELEVEARRGLRHGARELGARVWGVPAAVGALATGRLGVDVMIRYSAAVVVFLTFLVIRIRARRAGQRKTPPSPTSLPPSDEATRWSEYAPIADGFMQALARAPRDAGPRVGTAPLNESLAEAERRLSYELHQDCQLYVLRDVGARYESALRRLGFSLPNDGLLAAPGPTAPTAGRVADGSQEHRDLFEMQRRGFTHYAAVPVRNTHGAVEGMLLALARGEHRFGRPEMGLLEHLAAEVELTRAQRERHDRSHEEIRARRATQEPESRRE
jgi:hypothetical protein